MLVLNSIESNILRKKFVKHFVDTGSDYYKERIERLIEFCDGMCYEGYLWDCLSFSTPMTENELSKFLANKKNVYVMWDIHSCERILMLNYWKYPKDSVLLLNRWIPTVMNSLPEDIYIFDDTFTWSAIYTHETDKNGDRYCVYSTSTTVKQV